MYGEKMGILSAGLRRVIMLPTASGTYSVTVSSGACSGTQSVVVSVVTAPAASITPVGLLLSATEAMLYLMEMQGVLIHINGTIMRVLIKWRYECNLYCDSKRQLYCKSIRRSNLRGNFITRTGYSK